MGRKLDDDIYWHRMQIARLHEAIARCEPGKAESRGPSWGPTRPQDSLPSTMSGLRIQLDRFERTLRELQQRRSRDE
ncbi:MAG TPA: hypothetical protein VFV70_12730 [Hyphomonadaceae bacterium]|nr:hypothetical protein [Hyphomonadaceae bacterium]